MKLEDDNYCFACGKNNPCGLKLSFKYLNGKLTTEFIPHKIYQGYKDITHGGIITTILDEVMIQAAIAEGMTPVTAEISVRFKNPLLTNKKVIAEAEIIKRGSRLIEAQSRLLNSSDGTVIAEASAKLIPSK
ncbi:phenylacetic acid degradation protein [Dissulfurispira thermophila]|uniref:Acyl-coenzyme A thioesterase THEM4 n=2 Tax=root TaxID=1 RepID=A0A7G1GZP3_9BACT|nr:PaaI family thioesterase [Dissulfurispira thermophila]BCB95738.1 phenylacetic acid degradation protein [Dissulfurispira thermophila]